MEQSIRCEAQGTETKHRSQKAGWRCVKVQVALSSPRGKVTGERLALDKQGKRVAGCEGMIIACVSTNMSTVRSHDGHMMGT